MRAAMPSLPSTLPEGLCEKLKDIRVLVVDDRRYFRNVLAHMLCHVGITQIVEATTIGEAQLLLRRKPISLVICDYRLRDGTGLDLLASVRQGQFGQPCLPVLLLSGQLDRPLLRKAINGGFDDCMVKPLRPITLYQKIARLVQQPPTYVEIPDIYFGPDRRRRAYDFGALGERRKEDAVAFRLAGGISLGASATEDEPS